MKKSLLMSGLAIALVAPVSNNGMDRIKNSVVIVAMSKGLSKVKTGVATAWNTLVSKPWNWVMVKLGFRPAQVPPVGPAQVPPVGNQQLVHVQRPVGPAVNLSQAPVAQPAAQQPGTLIESVVPISAATQEAQAAITKKVVGVTEASSSTTQETPGRPEVQEEIGALQSLKESEDGYNKELALYKDIVYTVPEQQVLKSLDACPPFKGLVTEPLYNVLNKGQIEPRYATTKTPECSVSYKTKKGRQAQLMQLRTVNQSEIVSGERIFSSECPMLSVHNAMLMNTYAVEGKHDLLKDLYSTEKAQEAIEKIGCVKKLDKEAIDIIFATDEFKAYKNRIAVINNPEYVWDGHEEFRTEEENEEIKTMRTILDGGLKRDYFYYTWIMGNGDERELGVRAEHWYTITLLKAKNTIQYVVLDTVSHYHLQPGSYDFERLTKLVNFIDAKYIRKQ